MNRILEKSLSKKPYDRDNLKRAYQATLSGMSVYRASRLYKVPESTLRDRTRHNVSVDCQLGAQTLFSTTEETKLTEHIQYMASIGYGYTMTNIMYLAADYARSLGKDVKSKDSLSSIWFYAFLKRNPELKIVKPQKLEMSRAKGASQEKIDNYFHELHGILQEHDFMSAPERIYNIDETGISTQHLPPKIVCGKDIKPQSVTSPKSKNVTIIGGANALGNFIPPFYIFPGKRWNDQFLESAPAGSGGGMSESGWVNSDLFEKYLTQHLAKHAAIGTEKTLILYDGHKSHMSLTLANWARERNVILFVLPPHTSHLTQPLDVGVFGPLKRYYYTECQRYLQENPGISITKYEVAKLTARPYIKAFSPENIISAFKKSGIHPFNSKCISMQETAPSSIYQNVSTGDNTTVCEDEPSTENPVPNSTGPLVKDQTSHDFLDSRKISSAVVKPRPMKRFIPPYLSGSLSKASNINILQNQASSVKHIPKKQEKKNAADNKPVKIKQKYTNEKPSTSGTSSKTGGPICLDQDSNTESDSDIEVSENDKCCVCKMWTPKELKGCGYVAFVKWGQCDLCTHWVHLKFCTKVAVLRRSSVFRCPHCTTEE